MAALLLVLFLASCLHYVGMLSPLHRVSDDSSALSKAWPQGWSFFAKEPRSSLVVAFSLGSDREIDAGSLPGRSMFVRAGTVYSALAFETEAAALTRRVPVGDRSDCASVSVQACLDEALRRPARTLDDPVRPARICGPTLLAVVEPAPAGSRWPDPWRILSISNASIVCGTA